MNPNLILQLHVHSNRSHDSFVSIKDYVVYIESILSTNEYAVLGITDHNVVPLTLAEALKYSTNKVFVIPGIQWKIHKTFFDIVKRLCTRKELVTLGDHDDLIKFIQNETSYKVLHNNEILGNFKESQFLKYVEQHNIAIIVPHPSHFSVDYYGPRQIRRLKNTLDERNINNPFFVEEHTGYDPFPRIFYSYKGRYNILGGSDAHEIHSIVGTNSLFSVETSLNCSNELINLWQMSVDKRDILLYKKTIDSIFNLLQQRNDEIIIRKRYIRSIIHFLGSVYRWFKRRFNNFPHNLFK